MPKASMADTHAALLAKAQKYHQDRDIKAATKAYLKLTELAPDHPIALNNLGTIYVDCDACSAALPLLRRATEIHPRYVDAVSNLAICYGKLGHWRDCLRWSRKALALQEANPSAWLWLARAEDALGDRKLAIQSLETALRQQDCAGISLIADQYLEFCVELGQQKIAIRHLLEAYPSKREKDRRSILALLHDTFASKHGRNLFYRQVNANLAGSGYQPSLLYWKACNNLSQGDEDVGIQEMMQVVRLDPTHAGAWLKLGLTLKKKKNLPKAIACIRRSIREDQDNISAWQELTDCLIQNREFREAIRQSALARKRFPNNPGILLSHCHALLDGEKPGFAASFLDEHSKRHPNIQDANLLNCAGLALIQKREYKQAIDTFRSATKLARADAGIWSNRGIAYGMARRSRPEVHCYRRAIACNPDDPGSHVNLAMAYLAQQDFSNGLREYEWRLKSNGGSLNAAIRGRTAELGDQPEELLIVCEQGLGDTFHFCRYLYDLRHKLPNSTLILACPEKLKAIMGTFLGVVDAVIGCETTDLTNREYQYIPLMSLPYFCEIHPHRSIAPKAYLHIADELRLRIRSVIREHTDQASVVIGLNWRGNPETERSNLRGRSMPLEEMRVLANEIPGAVFVSLQKGTGSEEFDSCSFRHRFIHNQDIISKELCFQHAAAFCMACDYIVTTDTGLAHLSGALGQPTKILLAARPEWRWRGCEVSTPWYANTRAFYQRSPGNWSHPLREAAQQITTEGLGLPQQRD
jgi:Flp pilus assembly protein TadD